MTRSRFWGISAALLVGAMLGGMPLVTPDTTSEEQAAPPEVNVCVFYGICAP
jgi:hypothetical protein